MMSPKLVVFDLDATLWTPALCMLRGQQDAWRPRLGVDVELMRDVPEILESLVALDVRIGIASRTRNVEWARALLKEIELRDTTLFDMCQGLVEIFPGEKVAHFKKLSRASGVPFKEMIFFDDALDGRHGNCERVAQLGVLAVHTPDGLTKERWNAGLEAYAAGQRGRVVPSPEVPSLPLYCFSSVLPHSALILNGFKRLEMRKTSIFSTYEGKTMAVRIGFREDPEASWRQFVDDEEDAAKMKAGFRKCCVAGVVKVGRTVLTSTLASEVGWPRVEKLALTPRARCGEFATFITDPKWLKRAVQAAGIKSFSQLSVPLDALPNSS